jgi:hypothetical protein
MTFAQNGQKNLCIYSKLIRNSAKYEDGVAQF